MKVPSARHKEQKKKRKKGETRSGWRGHVRTKRARRDEKQTINVTTKSQNNIDKRGDDLLLRAATARACVLPHQQKSANDVDNGEDQLDFNCAKAHRCDKEVYIAKSQ